MRASRRNGVGPVRVRPVVAVRQARDIARAYVAVIQIVVKVEAVSLRLAVVLDGPVDVRRLTRIERAGRRRAYHGRWHDWAAPPGWRVVRQVRLEERPGDRDIVYIDALVVRVVAIAARELEAHLH